MDIACVAAIVHDDTGRLLVVRRGRPPSAGFWSIPGGKVEAGESDRVALRREVLEETGLDVVMQRVAGSVVLPAPNSEDRYLVTDYVAELVTTPSPEQPQLRAGDDAAEVRWVTAEELEALASDPGLAPGLAVALRAWGVWPGPAR